MRVLSAQHVSHNEAEDYAHEAVERRLLAPQQTESRGREDEPFRAADLGGESPDCHHAQRDAVDDVGPFGPNDVCNPEEPAQGFHQAEAAPLIFEGNDPEAFGLDATLMIAHA